MPRRPGRAERVLRSLVTLTALTALARPLLADPNSALAAAVADARKLPSDVRIQTRYLYTGNLPLDYREEAFKVLSFQVNVLSRESAISRPRPIGADLLAVVLADYKWENKVWEKLEDPYFSIGVKESWPGGFDRRFGRDFPAGTYILRASAPWLNSNLSAELISLTQSRVPICRADWWFSQNARQLNLRNKQEGVGYYDWLGIKSRKDFEKLIRLDEKASLDLGKEIRAAVDQSGVATQNRQIVRLQALTGGAWATLDVDDATGDGNATNRLKRGSFKHQAEEHFGVLPNGLPVVFLCDADGNLQPSAPDFIGPDDSPLRSGRDGRIHVGLSCWRCHVESYLRPIDDWVRRQSKTIDSPDYRELLALRRAYFSNLNRQLVRDREAYAEALMECNGLKPAENARAFARFWDRYVAPVSPTEAAAELGVGVNEMLAVLRSKRHGTPALADLAADPPVPVPRVQLEEAWPELATVVYGVKR